MAISDEFNAPKNIDEEELLRKKSFKEAFIPSKYDSPKERQWKYVSLVSIVVLIVCIGIIGTYVVHLIQAKQLNSDIYEKFQNAQANAPVTETTTEITVTTVPETDHNGETLPPVVTTPPPLVETPAALEMLAENKDYAGFVYIPNVLNEPIVHTTDNDYYLKHDFYDRNRQCGTVFMDWRNTLNDYNYLQSGNVIIYGHNQRDGTMFGNLDYYKWDPKYWLTEPFVYLENKYQSYTYVIVSSFITNTFPEHDNGNVFDYANYINFNENCDFDEFKTEISERSMFNTGIDFDETDKYLTFSTCSYEWDEARHVIVARRLRDDETTSSLDTTRFEVNDNPKYPAVYYKYNGGSYVAD